MIDEATNLQVQLRADLKSAMLNRRKDEVAVLRALIAAIDNAQAVPGEEPGGGQAQRQFGDRSAEVPRKAMSKGDLREVLESEYAARIAATQEYRVAGYPDRADRLVTEAEIVSRYIR